LSQAEGGVKTRAETTGDNWNISDWGDSSTVTWPTSQTSPSMLCTAEGTINSTVQYQDYDAEWKIKCTDGSNAWYYTAPPDQDDCRLYVVLDTPTAPQATPWLAVLDQAVRWAEGEDSEADALHEITSGLNGCGLDYVGGPQYSSFTSFDDQKFDLTQWLADEPWDNDTGNCADMGNLVHIYGNAIGASAQYLVKDGVSGNRVPGCFDTNYLDPVGSPGWNTTCWNYHQFGWADSKVYDASCKVDSDGSPESAPHTALLPTKLTEATFKSYVVKSGEDWTTVTGTPTVCEVE